MLISKISDKAERFMRNLLESGSNNIFQKSLIFVELSKGVLVTVLANLHLLFIIFLRHDRNSSTCQ